MTGRQEWFILVLALGVLFRSCVSPSEARCGINLCYGGPCVTSAACVSGCHCIGGRCS
jgi:hypothetical protein